MQHLRRHDKFRFSLQWGSDTEEKVQAGTLLERLGNKKSDFIVAAVAEYIQRHPEVAVPSAKIEITCHPRQTEAQMQELVRGMAKAAVEEYLAGKVMQPVEAPPPVEDPKPQGGPPPQGGPSNQDLDAMVANLKLFDMD